MKRIHVNRANLARNRKNATWEPPFTIQTSGGVVVGHSVQFVRGELKYTPEAPLACGAVAYVETRARVDVFVREGTPWEQLTILTKELMAEANAS